MNNEAIKTLWRAYGFIDGRFKLDEHERFILSLETRRALLMIDPEMEKTFPNQVYELTKDIERMKSMKPNPSGRFTARLRTWLGLSG